MNSLTIALALEGQLTLRADMIAEAVATGTTGQAAVIDTLVTLPDFMASLKTGTLDSEATIGCLQSFEFTINNNLEGLGCATHRLIQDLQANERHYEFNFTMGFSDKTEYELFVGGAAPTDTSTPSIPSLIFDVSNGTAVGSGRRQVYIKLLTAHYTTFKITSKVKGYITADFSGWAEGISSVYGYDDITSVNW